MSSFVSVVITIISIVLIVTIVGYCLKFRPIVNLVNRIFIHKGKEKDIIIKTQIFNKNEVHVLIGEKDFVIDTNDPKLITKGICVGRGLVNDLQVGDESAYFDRNTTFRIGKDEKGIFINRDSSAKNRIYNTKGDEIDGFTVAENLNEVFYVGKNKVEFVFPSTNDNFTINKTQIRMTRNNNI